MASRNRLLNGVEHEEVKVTRKTKPLKLYRKDCMDGRVFEGYETQEMMKRKGWTIKKPSLTEDEKEEIRFKTELEEALAEINSLKEELKKAEQQSALQQLEIDRLKEEKPSLLSPTKTEDKKKGK